MSKQRVAFFNLHSSHLIKARWPYGLIDDYGDDDKDNSVWTGSPVSLRIKAYFSLLKILRAKCFLGFSSKSTTDPVFDSRIPTEVCFSLFQSVSNICCKNIKSIIIKDDIQKETK